jgi:hypothetical protein
MRSRWRSRARATRGAQVKAALAERFDLTNVTLELEESPGFEPTPVPSTTTC